MSQNDRTSWDVTNWTRRDDAMVEEAIRRGASRRDLLRLLAASGVAMAAGSAIMTRATAAFAATPKKGGSITAAGWSSSTADTLDPAKASLSTDYVRCCSFYNRLTFLDEKAAVQMELAESVESDDAKTWKITLRPDVTFHDGKTLTTDDVIYSLQRHKDESVGSKANAMAQQMETFKKVDDRVLEIVLSAPNADLPIILSLHHFMIIADGTTDFTTANGTGAFKCETFEPGVKSVGVRNESYWKENLPYLDSIEFIAIPDETARVNALLSGDIALAAMVNPRSIRRLETIDTVTLSKTTSGNYTNLNVRLDMAPGDKKDFVDGLKYLVNREVIARSVMRDLAVIANDQPVSPNDRYYNEDLKPKDYDPEKAKKLFEKAGVLGQSIPIVASTAATSSIDMAMVVQQAGAEIGMPFEVQRVPSDGYWSNYWLKAPVHFGNINPRPTPDILFSLLYTSDAPWNESRYQSEKFDKMLVEARGTLDEAKRKEIYDEMQVMVSEDAGTIIPVWIANVDALSSKLKGLQPNPLGGMMGYAFAEYVWLDD
ncbi:ABC transporter substrate-binding protein [Afifella marina]|uniref:Peptide/nickel transport system substrate-binding protein n=1 Tax=Afifella marina DSM 2698 TaxID=1120955 RepID=A0A1G5NTW1_AFIMA|nr:ABC transporter substrate-binding protein [Afifella marina]MBK1624123.1 ABC transporter substrate-binding protein [Afifella marina DSM 2698]MBK1627680.1 ABC transporter substrate-binding protein [Afifella marina]MBK5916404.1 ABC transporter substrate-binding protein [Afifella marina]RAI20960.1 ABC transporter substrate-binding protein [Afifella marina DSM 2698]SCZ40793.1 peptide/nickel transport system substrate-binding protein [Afifella marina DSM 2698]